MGTVIKGHKITEQIVMTGTDEGDLVVITNHGRIFKLNSIDGWIEIDSPVED